MKKNFTFIKEKIKKQVEQLELEMSSAATQEDYKTYSKLEEKWLELNNNLKDIEDTEASEKKTASMSKETKELYLKISELEKKVKSTESTLAFWIFFPFSILYMIFKPKNK